MFMPRFKHLKRTVINHILIQEKIESGLNSGKVCYHLVQNLSSSHLLPNNLKIKIY
jgi:hypothetical protein